MLLGIRHSAPAVQKRMLIVLFIGIVGLDRGRPLGHADGGAGIGAENAGFDFHTGKLKAADG